MANQAIRWKTISTTVTTNVTIAAAEASARWRVVNIFYSIRKAGFVQWRGGTTRLSKIAHAVGAGRDSQSTPDTGLMETAVGVTLFLNTTAASAATLFYAEIGYVRVR